jgi:hypothetical protein
MRLHRGSRPLSCRFCGKAFIHSKRLQSHEASCRNPPLPAGGPPPAAGAGPAPSLQVRPKEEPLEEGEVRVEGGVVVGTDGAIDSGKARPGKKARSLLARIQADDAAAASELLAGDEKCAYFEISAKRNENVDKMFQTLFTMAKLPHEMSPDLHRKVSVQYCADMLHRKSVKSKKLKDSGDAFGIVAPFARRPSVHSDLLYIKEKAVGGGGGKEKERCSIS